MKKSFLWLIVALVIIFGAIWLVKTLNKPGQYDQFAQCISDSGASLYSTFWCSNCRNQKAKFGSSAELLSYVECSTADGKGQLPICAEAGITAYPTWILSDGTRQIGDTSLARLSEIISCPLPTK